MKASKHTEALYEGKIRKDQAVYEDTGEKPLEKYSARGGTFDLPLGLQDRQYHPVLLRYDSLRAGCLVGQRL